MSFCFGFFDPFLVIVHLLFDMLQNPAQSELYLDPAAAAEDVASRFPAIYQRERGRLNAKRELTRRRRGDRGPPLRPYLLHLPLTIDLRGMAFGKFASFAKCEMKVEGS